MVNKLYADFELQCGICGLRFNNKDKMAKHLDWHFVMNKKEKQKSKKAISRLWFLTSEEWVLGIDVAEKPAVPFFGAAGAEPASTDEAQEGPLSNVLADETQTHCAICSEKFDQFWDNEGEEWLYRGTVRVEGTGQIFHQKCYEQAVALSRLQQQPVLLGDQQPAPSDILAATAATAEAQASAATAVAAATMRPGLLTKMMLWADYGENKESLL